VELRVLAGQLVEATNEAYLAAFGVPDLGSASAAPAGLAEVDAAIEAGFGRVAGELSMGHGFEGGRGRAKPMLASPVMSRLGLLGIYFPWTGEANFNALAPAWQLPMSIAHEKAHQRGIAGEDEANFLGFLAAARADDPYVRYSAYLFAQRQLLNELLRLDEEAGLALLARRLPGVQRDVDFSRAYWARFEGPAREAQQAFNDRYLEFHEVEGGIDAYGRSAQLIVLYARARGGDAVPGTADPPGL
jgi:hypothetical protein